MVPANTSLAAWDTPKSVTNAWRQGRGLASPWVTRQGDAWDYVGKGKARKLLNGLDMANWTASPGPSKRLESALGGSGLDAALTACKYRCSR